MHARGNSDWRQLTIKEDLETGDVVRTGFDGRVEMLLNPGSYMRIGENSEFELADNSLENLEVRLIRELPSLKLPALTMKSSSLASRHPTRECLSFDADSIA